MRLRVAILAFGTLKNFLSKYRVDTRRGKIFNRKTKKEVAVQDQRGYCFLKVKRSINGKKITHAISRSSLVFWAKYKYLPNVKRCIDHKDGVKTNDRASNLQDISWSQNLAKKRKKNRYYGVYYDKKRQRYVASIEKDSRKTNGKRFQKRFLTEKEAAVMRDQMIVNLYKNEYERDNFMPPLNFPEKIQFYMDNIWKNNQKPRMVQMQFEFA